MAMTNGSMAEQAIMQHERQAGDDLGREATDTAAGIKLTALQQKRRKQRNVALGIALAGFVALFYLITLVKLGSGAHH